MANTHSTLTELFIDIADAIREKNGNTDPIVADAFPIEIENLRTGFDYVNSDIVTIPDYAFYDCEDLKSVDCYKVTSIGISAFEGCTNLQSVILYEYVESIGENAFKGCNTVIYCMFDSQPETWHENWNPDNCEVVYLGGAVKTWDISNNYVSGNNVIAKLYNNITEGYYRLIITGNGSMRSLSNSNPWDNYKENINYVIIDNGITNIGVSAFMNCVSLISAIISNNVTSIEANAFQGCASMTSIIIPDNVKRINRYAFHNCKSLTSITIPDSVTIIDAYAFCNCSSLKAITISDSVTTIYTQAFDGCTSLTFIIYTGAIEQWNAISFGSIWDVRTGSYTIHCTDGTIAKDGTITYYKSV